MYIKKREREREIVRGKKVNDVDDTNDNRELTK